VGRKRILQVILRKVEGKVPNEQFCAHLISVSPDWPINSRLFPRIGSQIITEQNSLDDFHAERIKPMSSTIPKVAGFNGIASAIRL
jgi:hypothetical protein